MQTMKRFEQTKTELLNVIRLAENFVKGRGVSAIHEELKTVYNTLEREQFEVMVVGEFSNGKSTFINALLQNNVLPTSNVPTTALINKISYAPQPAFEVHYDNGKKEKLNQQNFLEFVSDDKRKIDGAKDAILQKLNPMAKQATHLEIGYPTEICANNIVIIDSPGTNDMDERRVKITDEYIPRSDAAIFVLNAKKIFSASERAFLQRIMDADIQKIFFVINFKDVIQTEEDFKEIERVVLENLPEQLTQPKVHFVSALHALQHYVPTAEPTSARARRKMGARLSLEESGMPQLESALLHFLSYDSGVEKLRKPVERTKRLMQELLDHHITFEINTLSHSIENIEKHVSDIRLKLLQVEKDLKKNVSSFQRKIEKESDQIVIWYKKQLTEITKAANTVLEQGLRDGEDPEIIKTDIDFATGPIEKRIQTELQKRTARMTETLLKNEANILHESIAMLSANLVASSSQKAEWSHEIIVSSSDSDEVADYAIGGAVVGGLALLITGGTFGWGLLGAGVGAAAAGGYITSKQTNDVTSQLRRQVRERYESGLTKRAKNIEKALANLAEEMKDAYEQHTRKVIESERQKTQKLLNNQHLSASEQQTKIEQLKQQQQICQSLMFQTEKVFANYKMM